MYNHPVKRGPYHSLKGAFFVFAHEGEPISRGALEKQPKGCQMSTLAVVFILVVIDVSWISGPNRALPELPPSRVQEDDWFVSRGYHQVCRLRSAPNAYCVQTEFCLLKSAAAAGGATRVLLPLKAASCLFRSDDCGAAVAGCGEGACRIFSHCRVF